MEDSPRSLQNAIGQIQSEPLQNLLTAVRRDSVPIGKTHIPTLENSLTAPADISSSSLRRGDVIEIQGPASSGKTHLLYHLVVTCVLPSESAGWNKLAIVLDADGAFDIRRFRHLLQTQITQHRLSGSAMDTSSNISDTVSRALRNLRLFRPSSSLQLAANLASLSAYHGSDLPSSEIALLAIDSISAFYWPDRFNLEHLSRSQFVNHSMERTHSDDFRPAPHASPKATNALHHILDAIQRFRLSHAPVTVVTNWGLNPAPTARMTSDSTGPTFYKQHLHPFPTLEPPFPHDSRDVPANQNTHLKLTHQITLQPVPLTPFPSGISLSDAQRLEVLYRRPLAKKRETRAYVKTGRRDQLGIFSFRIGADAVDIGGE